MIKTSLDNRLSFLLAPKPGRFGFSLRVASIAALVAIVAEAYGVGASATVYIVFFTNKFDRASSIKSALTILIGISVILMVGLTISAFVVNSSLEQIVAISMVSIVLLYIGSASKFRPLAPGLAMIVGFYLDEIGGFEAGEDVSRSALYIWLLPAIPVGVGLIVNLLFAPRPRPLLHSALVLRVRAVAAAVRSGGVERADACLDLLKGGDGELRDLLSGARFEHSVDQDSSKALSCAIASTVAMLSAAEVIARTVPRVVDDWCEEAATTLDGMAGMLEAGGYPINIGLIDPPIDGSKDVGPADQAIVLLHASIIGYADGVPPSTQAATGFFASDAISNPDYLSYAMKTTGSAMICYLAYHLLNWPGIHTCLITCYVVALGSVAETIEKMSLRIAGAIIGVAIGLAAVVWLLPHMTTIASLVVLIFAMSFVCAWITAGGPRISYAGFQIAFAFYLSVLQKPYPAFDLSVGRDRVIGILLGTVVTYAVFTRIRPSSLAASVDTALLKAVSTLSEIVPGRGGSPFGPAPAQARNQVAVARNNLAAIRYEPSSIRPDAEWLNSRGRTVAELDAAQSAVVVAAGRDPALALFLQTIAGRFDSMRERSTT